MKKSKNLSIASKSLNYKLKIAFSLMAVLPLLVSTYLISSYVFPRVGLKVDIVVSMILSIVIAVIGLLVIKEIFNRVMLVSDGAKIIAAGDYFYQLKEAGQDDEVGDLGEALNRLTQRIRSNMNEIKDYSLKTTEINLDIQKRVLVLSSLLQISSLISEGSKLEEISKAIAEKAKLLVNADTAYILYRQENQDTFYLSCAEGPNAQQLLDIRIESTDEIFYKISDAKKPLILDKDNFLSADLTNFLTERMKLRNCLLLPVRLRGRVIQLLGLGNSNESYAFPKEDIELLDIFVKQLAIACENDALNRNVKMLETKDCLTGLCNEGFMRNRLQEEIRRSIAYQRPCSFVLMNIDNFKLFANSLGSLQTESVIKNIAKLIKESVSEIDRVGRIGGDEFAIILPEKSKRQAKEVAEAVRKKIMDTYSQAEDPSKRITISAGVSENPLDGINSDELISRAQEFLLIAKAQGRNRVVIFKER